MFSRYAAMAMRRRPKKPASKLTSKGRPLAVTTKNAGEVLRALITETCPVTYKPKYKTKRDRSDDHTCGEHLGQDLCERMMTEARASMQAIHPTLSFLGTPYTNILLYNPVASAQLWRERKIDDFVLHFQEVMRALIRESPEEGDEPDICKAILGLVQDFGQARQEHARCLSPLLNFLTDLVWNLELYQLAKGAQITFLEIAELHTIEEMHEYGIGDVEILVTQSLPAEDRTCIICSEQYTQALSIPTPWDVQGQGILNTQQSHSSAAGSSSFCKPARIKCGHIVGHHCLRRWQRECLQHDAQCLSRCPMCRTVLTCEVPETVQDFRLLRKKYGL